MIGHQGAKKCTVARKRYDSSEEEGRIRVSFDNRREKTRSYDYGFFFF